MADERTQEEEIEQREKLIEVMMEQARTGQKGIDLDIQRYLQYTKSGKAITEATKATKTLTGGFKDSAKALGTSTGNFSDLTSAVTGTIKAVSGLLSNIPVVGKAFAALGDAAAETASFAIGQVQANYDSFKELAKAGQIGADGVTGMARNFDEAGIPLATYTKLLGSHSEELAYFSSSALAGGKTFSQMIAGMDGDTKTYMRNLGYSIEEIGESAIEYQALQRRRGFTEQLTQDQLTKGTAQYVEELDALAKLTGQNVSELKKQRDEVRSDSRFRARLMKLNAEGNKEGAKRMEMFTAIMKKAAPELSQGFSDMSSGAINTAAAQKLTVSGMYETAKKVQEGLEAGTIDIAQGMTMMRDSAKEAGEVGGAMHGLAGFINNGEGPFLDLAKTVDFGNMEIKKMTDLIEAQRKVREKPDATTDKLSNSMAKLESSIATVNKFFIATPAATATIEMFAGALHKTVNFIDEHLTGGGASDNGLVNGRPAKTAMTSKQMADSKEKAAALASKDQIDKLKEQRRVLEGMGKTEADIVKQLNYTRQAMNLPLLTGKAASAVTPKSPSPATAIQPTALAAPNDKPVQPRNNSTALAKADAARSAFAQKDEAFQNKLKSDFGKPPTAENNAINQAMIAELRGMRTEMERLTKLATEGNKNTQQTARAVQ